MRFTLSFKRVVLLGLLMLLYPAYGYYVFCTQPLFSQGTVIELRPGMSLRSLSHDLASAGMKIPAKSLERWGRLLGMSSQLKYGEYAVPMGMSAKALLHRIVDGEVLLHRATLVEGWTLQQMLSYLNADPAITPSFKELNTQSQEIIAALGLDAPWAEGWFLPNTYFYTKGETAKVILQRAHLAMKQKLAYAWERRGTIPLKSMEEALIVASMIEKETGVDSERPLVAAVVYNRMRLKMRLQLDPTVIYGMGASYRGSLTRKDLLRATPFNTYTNFGLPPTPIACPSMKSIEAALHPADSPVLYFVAQGDGTHVFSTTLVEHQRAVLKYRQSKTQTKVAP